ncbi:MAG: class I SAM-dependent methyltransferase [Rhizobiales bacterium]|nr:class I SAM-dependent methyltransferase [Hyphomicrobiales bacterium]
MTCCDHMPDVPLVQWRPRAHNGARYIWAGTLPLEVRVTVAQWCYAMSLPLDQAVLAQAAATASRLLVEVSLTVFQGRVGVGCVGGDGSTYVTDEREAGAADGPVTLILELDPAAGGECLMLRNADAQGSEGHAVVNAVTARCGNADWELQAAPFLARDDKPLPLAELSALVTHFGTLPGASPAGHIDSLPLTALAERLGFADPPPPVSGTQPALAERRMEIDDLPLLRYLYKHHRPARHLEFGTWEGIGVVACAEECEAEIWTLNLPDGENDAAGRPAYGADRSDSGSAIGWRYRAAGFAPRVHQLLCDSREWRDDQLPDGYFDSVLIDGGHTAEVVASDTGKALRLLRPGGLCLWHDFCPSPRALMKCGSTRGVARAVVDHWPHWRPLLRDAFWLRPSWVLVGVRA